jgi:hypothetical protein
VIRDVSASTEFVALAQWVSSLILAPLTELKAHGALPSLGIVASTPLQAFSLGVPPGSPLSPSFSSAGQHSHMSPGQASSIASYNSDMDIDALDQDEGDSELLI